MGVTHVTVALKGLGSPNGTYEADFLVDTGATDSLAPAAKLKKIGVQPVGTMAYELADGTIHEYQFGLVRKRSLISVIDGTDRGQSVGGWPRSVASRDGA